LGKSAALVGSTTLFQAAEDPAMAEKLDAIISSGEDLNAKDSEGKTALHHAVSADNSAAVVKLVRANADPSIKDGQGRTAEELGEQEQKVNALQALDRAMIKAMRTRK
jgi:ankyrin repeat protein